MVAQTKKRDKRGRLVKQPPLPASQEILNLRERLSAPRLHAPGTLSGYEQTARRFLEGIKHGAVPTDHDFRAYFIRRRKEGISEATLQTEYAQLKKLYEANTWEWQYTKHDSPRPEERTKLPVMRPEDVELMIKSREALSKAERFYLAVSTTWLVRREELTRIKKRDYDDQAISIDTAKHGKKARHLIPDCLKPIFLAYTPKEHRPSSMSEMFKRICRKAGVQDQPKLGWHSIRYTLDTLLSICLPRNGLDPGLLRDYGHWKARTSGSSSWGTDMTQYYRRPEIVYTDPFGVDKVIYGIHPFLHLWDEKIPDKAAPKTAAPSK